MLYSCSFLIYKVIIQNKTQEDDLCFLSIKYSFVLQSFIWIHNLFYFFIKN